MKFFKTLFLLSISSLAINAWADSVWIYSVSKGVELEDGSIYKGPVYADGTEMLEGETALLIFAHHNSTNTVDATAEELFEINKFGEVALTSLGESSIVSSEVEGETTYKFEVFPFVVSDKGALIVENSESARVDIDDSFYKGDTWFASATATESSTLLSCAYLVRFDSRYFDPETDTIALGDTVQAWSAERLTYFYVNPNASPVPGGTGMGANPIARILLDFTYTTTALTRVDNPVPTTITALPTSLIVTKADGTETTLTGDELTEHLTPSMVATAPIEDGFALSCKSSDVLTYTLQTKASLSEGWVNFDTIAENLLADINENLDGDSKKTLANNFEKRYTCLRVKESTQIKIPQSPKETQRFYRLIAE